VTSTTTGSGRSLVATLVLAWLVLSAPFVGSVAGEPATPTANATDATNGTADGTTPEPAVLAVHPNPVATGDRGEFVVVRGAGGHVLTDGEGRVRVPGDGRVVLTAAPSLVPERVDGRRVEVPLPSLANGGERLRLVSGNRTVATVRYGEAPEGAVRVGPDRWRQLGTTNRTVVRTTGGRATAFVLPDAPGPPLEAIRAADRRILLAAYTFGSARVTAALLAAHERGVEVRVLVDGGPVGGMTRRSAGLLDRLADAGVEVRVLDGRRYAFQHAKYAVVDDGVLVTTENWKPAGTGGHDSRGWGVHLRDPEAAAALASTFRADADWRGVRDWSAFRAGRRFEPATPANGSYPGEFAPNETTVDAVSVLLAPDNAAGAVVQRIADAERSVRVLQVGIGGPDQRFLRATLRAARRGVEVRVLLSGAWYVAEDNRRLVAWLNERATEEELPLTARLAEPGGRFGKVHAKGVTIDRETVLVGSLNWNEHSATENREVVLALRSEALARYFGRAFDADWRRAGDGGGPLPLGLLAVVAAGAVVVLVAARRLRFE
jgi:phosphatidylserine/phosphatidylglycerophosphate/cardiolipin synthase-like enzyme